jgi:hypothetical protein
MAGCSMSKIVKRSVTLLCVIMNSSLSVQSAVIQSLSYNQIIEKLIEYNSLKSEQSEKAKSDRKAKDLAEQVAEAKAAENIAVENGEAEAEERKQSEETKQSEEGKQGAEAKQGEGVAEDSKGAEDSTGAAGESKGAEDSKGADDSTGVAGESKEGEAVALESKEAKYVELDPFAVATVETKDEVGEPDNADPENAAQETDAIDQQAIDQQVPQAVQRILHEGRVVEGFLSDTASQLTYFGLLQLHEHVRDRQVGVFFRNNHFSTLFKHNGSLYLLATDAGYEHVPGVVWERLNEIDGDTDLFDSEFNAYQPVTGGTREHQQQDEFSHLNAQAAAFNEEAFNEEAPPGQVQMPEQLVE